MEWISGQGRRMATWQELRDELEEMRADSPGWSTAEQGGLCASGALLPERLLASEHQHGEALEEAIGERLLGVEWPEDLPLGARVALEIRLEWAALTLSALDAAGAPPPSDEFPLLESLLLRGWENGGFSTIHEGCLRRLLSAALAHSGAADPGDPAG